MTIIKKGFNLQLYPNEEQTKMLSRTFGCVRFVYNQMLNMQKERHDNGGNTSAHTA